MPAEDDIGLAEKRVYAAELAATVAYVGSDIGLTEVTVSGDQVGRFSLVHREPVVDVAGADGQVLVATAGDVLVGAGEEFQSSGFGAAFGVPVAVGLHDGTPLAASVDGAVARLVGDDWEQVGEVPDVRAIDGPYLGSAQGLARVTEAGEVTQLGLDDVRDVAAAGPYAATGAGLFADDDGWTVTLDGDFDVVAADSIGRVHAVGEDYWVMRDGEWVAHSVPVEEAVVDVALGESVYAVTESGTFLVDADAGASADGAGGWRSRMLGIGSVTGLAVA